MSDETRFTGDAGQNMGGGGLTRWVASGVCAALLFVNVFLLWRTTRLEEDLRTLRSSVSGAIHGMHQTASAAGSATERSLEQLGVEVRDTRNHSGTVAARARSSAEKHAEKLVSDLEQKQMLHLKRQEELALRLGEIQQNADSTDARLSGVITDVGSVRGGLAQTRTDLDRTTAEISAELKSVRGDLGVQSGLIATNARQLAALREIGERDYFEFDVRKASGPRRLGSVVVILRKTDARRHRFTIDLLANDRKVEKKDRTINEPVQFHVAGGRHPFELVVNEVHKDRIVGYLATPRVIQAQR